MIWRAQAQGNSKGPAEKSFPLTKRGACRQTKLMFLVAILMGPLANRYFDVAESVDMSVHLVAGDHGADTVRCARVD